MLTSFLKNHKAISFKYKQCWNSERIHDQFFPAFFPVRMSSYTCISNNNPIYYLNNMMLVCGIDSKM